MIEFKCPQCGEWLHVKNKMGGGQGACPACKAAVPIPRLSSTPSAVEVVLSVVGFLTLASGVAATAFALVTWQLMELFCGLSVFVSGLLLLAVAEALKHLRKLVAATRR